MQKLGWQVGDGLDDTGSGGEVCETSGNWLLLLVDWLGVDC